MPTETVPVSAPTIPTTTRPDSAGQSFDTSFPDDGLDTPPEPIATPKPAEVPQKKGADALQAQVPKEPVTPETPPKPAAQKPEVSTADDDEMPSDFTPPQVGTAKDIKAWATRVGKWAQKMTSKADVLQKRVQELESQPPQQADDASNLAQELASAKKKLDEYENELRLTKFERSSEYKEKFQKPYETAVARAYREVKELIAYEPNPDDPDTPRERAAVPQDFDEIYSLPLGQASRLAKSRFGDSAVIVLQHRQAIRQLAEEAYAAIEEYKTKGNETESQSKAQQAQYDAAMQKMFTAATEGHAKRAPELFSERDGDSEGNDLLAKGRQFAGAVFGGNDGLTPQQIAFRDGMAYNRLAAYPRLLRDNKKLKADLAEAQKAIESIRQSGPGIPKPRIEKKSETGYKDALSAFDEVVPA